MKTPKLLFATFLVFISSFLSFTQSLRFFATTDSLPNNFVAMNIIFNNRIDLTNYKEFFVDKDLMGIAVVNDDGIVFSKTPPILGVLSAPPFILINKYFGINQLSEVQAFESVYHQYAGKITAALYTALSAALIFLIANQINRSIKLSLLSTSVYVFCTSVFNTASQVNWQHGISLFFITLFIWIFIVNPQKALNLFIAGLIAGLFTQIRISNAFYIFLPLAFLYMKYGFRKSTLLKMLIILIGSTITYGAIYYWYKSIGVPSGYAGEIVHSLQIWRLDTFLANLLSILFSFNFGLFFYSPILLIGVLGLRRLVKERSNRGSSEVVLVLSALPVAIIFIVFASSWWMWIGGGALNARLLSESVPVYIFLLNYTIKQYSSRILMVLLGLTFIVSFYMNFLTTYQLEKVWWDKYLLPGNSMYNRNAWFADPFLARYMFENNYIYHVAVYRKGDEIIERTRVFRPSIYYRGVTKLFDNESVILKID